MQTDTTASIVRPIQSHAFGAYEAQAAITGHARHLVIALSGVGNVHERMSSFDFYKLLDARPEVDKILIRDQNRSWYQCPDGWAELVGLCKQVVQMNRYDSVTLLGISMGAFGALHLASHLSQARVVALGPSISVDTEKYGRYVVRHKKWLDADPRRLYPDAAPSGDPDRYLILFGDGEYLDLINAERFFETGWANVFVCPGGGHNLGVYLNTHRLMRVFMDLLCSGRPLLEIAAAAGAYPAFMFCQAFQLRAARKHLYQGSWTEADRCLHFAAAGSLSFSSSLRSLLLLRSGLQGPVQRAIQQVDSSDLPSVTTALHDGWSAQFRSSEAVSQGDALALGPFTSVVLTREEPLDEQEVTVELLAAAPARYNTGGDRTLHIYHVSREGELKKVHSATDPQKLLSFAIPVCDGKARFFMRRQCFSSGVDERGNDDQRPWSVRITSLKVTAPRLDFGTQAAWQIAQ